MDAAASSSCWPRRQTGIFLEKQPLLQNGKQPVVQYFLGKFCQAEIFSTTDEYKSSCYKILHGQVRLSPAKLSSEEDNTQEGVAETTQKTIPGWSGYICCCICSKKTVVEGQNPLPLSSKKILHSVSQTCKLINLQ